MIKDGWPITFVLTVCVMGGMVIGAALTNQLSVPTAIERTKLTEGCRLPCRIANFDSFEINNGVCWCVTTDYKINLSTVTLHCGVLE